MVTPTHYLGTLIVGTLFLVAKSGALPAPTIHYWLNDGQGSSAHSSVKTAQDASLVGPGSFWSSDTPSGEGYSYRIDSRQSSYLSIPAEAQLNNLKDFTISWWMKLSSVDGNTDRIFSTRASHEAGEGYLDLIARSDTPGHLDLEFVFSNGHHNGRTTVRIDNLKADEWLFLALVRDTETGDLKVYSCPAGPTAEMKVSGHPANRATNINNSPSSDMLIGSYPGDSKNRTPDGLFYDWRFYREALAPAAITTVFTQGLNGQE